MSAGLDGVVAAETQLSCVDGQAGKLVIRGYAVEELAGRATFEETVYLLWHGNLPNVDELGRFRERLAAERELPLSTLDLLRSAAAERAPLIDALRMASGTLSMGASGRTAQDECIGVVARFPVIVAAYWRLLHGAEPLPPRSDLAHAANYLYMLSGEAPSPERVRGLETYLNTVVDHGLNASTFTARVIISTRSDVVSAVTGAVGALKGPLHGGAPGPALEMVFEIGSPERAEPEIRARLERGERLMGFGHRIYRVRDPRAAVLAAAAERLFQADGDLDLYRLARHVEETALRLLKEHKPGRALRTNVEFYTALLLHGLGLDPDLFTPTFAVSRVAGWTAHCLEQLAEGRIIRPDSRYVGPVGRTWTR